MDLSGPRIKIGPGDGMNSLFSAFLNRFQLRLLLFLLLVGSIPLIVATFVFYAQSASYASEEQSAVVEQTHKRLLERAKLELVAIDKGLRHVADDYGVGRYVSRTSQPLDMAEEKRIREYIDFLLKKELSQNRYILQMCITMEEAGQALCAQSGSAQVPFDTVLGRPGRKLIPVASPVSITTQTQTQTSSSAGSQKLLYTEPIMDARLRMETGTVYALFSIDQIIVDAQEKSFQGAMAIYDEEKRLIYTSSMSSGMVPGSGWSSKGTVQSQSKLEVADVEWSSTLELKVEPNASLINMRNLLIWLFMLLAIVSVVSSIWFAGHVTKPLHHLRGLMKRAELGDLKAYWIDDGMDELNDLGQSYNQMLNRVEELIKQVKQEEALKKEAEMEALQYQLNPHFLYNTLNTIKWVAKIHKTPQISEVVSSLVRLLQASLGKKGDFITIREETGLIRDYMDIQSFRYGERIRLAFEIDELAAGCLVPRMILQPLVENAILHGIEPGKREGVITIRAYVDRDLLLCEVEDDGVGIASKAAGEYEPAALTHPVKRRTLAKERLSGVGIAHIREKIKLYYGPDYKMFIINRPGEGTTVKMFLPVHQSEE